MLRNARQVNETIRARSYGAKFTFCLLADNLEFCEIAKLSPLRHPTRPFLVLTILSTSPKHVEATIDIIQGSDRTTNERQGLTAWDWHLDVTNTPLCGWFKQKWPHIVPT